MGAAAHDQLAPDAVPLMLRLPFLRCAERFHILQHRARCRAFRPFDGIGQVERVGA